MALRRSATAYTMFGLLGAAAIAVLVLGWDVARDFRQSADAAAQLYDGFGEGLDLIDDMLFETEEVRRILLYALHTSDANRQLQYVDESRAAEERVKELLDQGSPILATPRTRQARESVSAAWAEYLRTRDDVIGLILEGSVNEGVALDQALGTERFNRVRSAIADLKAGFQADAAVEVDAQRARSSRATARLGLIVLSALLLVAIVVYLVNRRASLEVVLRVKSDFLTTMSHELRTPLTGVIGIAELLQTSPIPPGQRELVRMLRTNATTLLGLVNNVLDYSRIDAGLMTLVPRRFAVHTPVEEALDGVSELASRKGLALGYIIDPDVPDVLADHERVRQVLLNLLSNAVKYTESGQVSVHVAATRQQNDTVLITVSVRDTGIGIPEAVQPRLFQWFGYLEPPGGRRVGGTGLGLAISDRLSRLLGGSITVDSRPGEGSTFTFVFRGAVDDPERVDPADVVALRGTRVLLAHRPGIVRDQIASLLSRWNVTAVLHDGTSLMPGEPIDAVIAEAERHDDGDSGLLAALAGADSRRVPVIAVTPLRSTGGRAIEPADFVITTPVRMQALRETLLGAIGHPRIVADDGERTSQPFGRTPAAVLLVEDNESNRRVVSMMLGELGLSADEAGGGYEAIQQAARRKYDVILMDVQMPDLDGLEATRRIRSQENGHHATIIALTANVLESDEARCRAAGMDGYLQKPLGLDTLSTTLSAAVARRSPTAPEWQGHPGAR